MVILGLLPVLRFRPGACAGRAGKAFLLVCCLILLCRARTPPPAAEVPAQPWEGKPTRVFCQDVGLVRPGQKVRHRFAIANDSAGLWTLTRLHNSCVCTASRPLAEVVRPGDSMEVDVDYTAPARSADDHRRVGVEFAEVNAPFVWLEIRARVREPVTVFPPELRVVRDDRGQPRASLEVHNCSDGDVRLLSVRATAAWLAVREPVPATAAEYGGARQVWRVAVEAKADGLTAGRHQADLELKTDCPEAPVKIIPVELDLREPVRVVPGHLAFGAVTPGAATERKALLRYPTRGLPLGRRGVIITHNLGEQLQVDYVERSASLGELSAVLTPAARAAGGGVLGKVVVTFEGGDLPLVEIPVSAQVKRP